MPGGISGKKIVESKSFEIVKELCELQMGNNELDAEPLMNKLLLCADT